MDVYCLCAEWCGVCRALKPALEALQLPGIRLHWVDIEEQPEWGDEHEVDSFPTLVVKVGQQTRFAGVVEPRLSHIQRLLLSLQGPPTPN